MSALAIADMFDDLDSTRVKLRLVARRRHREEETARDRADSKLLPPPPGPDEEIPSGGFQ